MRDLILSAKHWQIFIFIFGIPMLMQFVFSATLLGNVMSDEVVNPSTFAGYFIGIGAIYLICASVFFLWLWFVGTGLQSQLPDDVTMNVTRFKIYFFIPMVYFVLIIFFVVSIFMDNSIAVLGSPATYVFILIIHLFSMFCIFYCLYFVAKTYKSVELQREVKFGDFVGEFFMVWFLMIGIWILQPKINEMLDQKFDLKDSLL